MQEISAAIYGVSGTVLTEEEQRFFAERRPAGAILFSRNINNKLQLAALTGSLREAAGHPLMILIDQEGGRVSRLPSPEWPAMPAMSVFRIQEGDDREEAASRVRLHGASVGAVLKASGINVNCAPVCDLEIEGAHDIIGDRSFGSSPEDVILLARAYSEGLMHAGVAPVIKHIPGHGRARCDSHVALPRVEEALSCLEAGDFAVFKALADLPLAMTAHIVYTALDPYLPATVSERAIHYIRQEIGFKGALMSDDIGMKALSGGFGHIADDCIRAGCDLVLHCSGKMDEMQQTAPSVPAANERVHDVLSRFS